VGFLLSVCWLWGVATGEEAKQANQIFSHFAASGILTNDLIKIIETEQEIGFSAEPVDDNIYQWSVKMFGFDPSR
jgi:baculoviral IAP repeat-containing protein 6